jgi:hypothetical protein
MTPIDFFLIGVLAVIAALYHPYIVAALIGVALLYKYFIDPTPKGSISCYQDDGTIIYASK